MPRSVGSSVFARWTVVVVFAVIQACRCTRSDCQPADISREQLSVWLRQHRHLALHLATDGRPRRDLPHPPPSSDANCSSDNPCDPTAPAAGCYRNRDLCDGLLTCVSGRDELHCDTSLCAYHRAGAVSMKATDGETHIWSDVTLRGCARLCNDIHPNCVAFSFRVAPAMGGQCRVFFTVGRLQAAPGSELFIRDAPSKPRLATAPVTSFESNGVDVTPSVNSGMEATSSGRTNQTVAALLTRSLLRNGETAAGRRVARSPNCSGRDMFKCLSFTDDTCLPYSQVCDGTNQCEYSSDEFSCDSYFSSFEHRQGLSIVSDVQLRGVNKNACAVYCTKHLHTFPSCDSFSFNKKQRSCSFGCSWCGDAARVVKDAEADYYKYVSEFDRLQSSIRTSETSSGSSISLADELFSGFGSQSTRATTEPPREFTTRPATTARPTAAPVQSSSVLLPTDCGRRPQSSSPDIDPRLRVLSNGDGSTSRRVVGGQRVAYGAYPWQVQIQVYGDSGHFEHHCGGALIGERLVLTAAHCLRPALTRLQVKLGQHDRRDAGEQFEQTFAVENALKHPGYRSDLTRGDVDDIAVLKLRLRQGQAVRFSSHVQPLCLPSGPPPPTGQECDISGWGKTDASLPDVPSSAADVLHGATVPLVSDTLCSAREVYGERFVAGRMVCAGHLAGGPDACQGDSGGPLACPAADGRWQLTGIVSFGEGCGGLLKPGVYTSVSHYVSWIQRAVQLL